MAAVFDLSDNSVVAIVRSGAGAERLGNWLAEKGIDVVCREAGPRLTLADTANDKQGRAVHAAVGAIKAYERRPFPAGNDVGTCRMSANSRGGLVNDWYRRTTCRIRSSWRSVS